MTKTALALAVALIAGTAASTAANAGGIRLGFGFPLGSFVAKPFQGSNGGYSHKKRNEKPQYEAARQAPKKSAPKAEVAETRKSEPKVVKTAKVDTGTATDAAPAEATTTSQDVKQVTIEKTTTTAALTPATTEDVKVDTTPVKRVEKVEVEETPKTSDKASDGKKVCRKFSPVVGGLVDIPCE